MLINQAVNLFPGFSFIDPVIMTRGGAADGEAASPAATPKSTPTARASGTADSKKAQYEAGDKERAPPASARVQEALEGSPQRLTQTTSAHSSRTLASAFSSLIGTSPKRNPGKNGAATLATPTATSTDSLADLNSPELYPMSPADGCMSPYNIPNGTPTAAVPVSHR